MPFTVYLVTNTVNGKKYVGVTTVGIAARWKEHLHTASKKDSTTRALASAIRKYGADAFVIEMLEEVPTEEEMFDREQHHVAALNTKTPNGYNMTLGGEGVRGIERTAELRQKLADAARGKPANPNQRRALSSSPASKGRRIVVWHKDSPESRREFPSAGDAAKFIGVSYTSLCNWTNNGRPSRSGRAA